MLDRVKDRQAVRVLLLPLGVTGALTAAGALQPLPGAAIGVATLVAGAFLWRRRRRAVVSSPVAVDGPRPTTAELVECLPDPVILLNDSREVVACNAAARESLGVGPVGRDLALSLRHPVVLAAAESVAQGAPSFADEVTLPSPIPRTFSLYAATVSTGEASQPKRIILVFRDETQVKRAEQSRADFVANASHELRSPLSAIIGFIETLLGPASDDEEARIRFLNLMHGEAQRMARLIDDLMSLSRVEINEHIPPRITVDVAGLVRGVTSTLAVRAEKKEMTLDVTCESPLPAVIGDLDQLTQVFHNLIDNAVKYGRPGTPIRVQLCPVDRFPGTSAAGVSISVADEGDGIPAIHLPRLTERFYRADEGRSRRLGGTGLGLAIVKHIVKRHRGRLTIESELGHGSTFTVFLPATSPPPTRDSLADSGSGSDDVTKG